MSIRDLARKALEAEMRSGRERMEVTPDAAAILRDWYVGGISGAGRRGEARGSQGVGAGVEISVSGNAGATVERRLDARAAGVGAVKEWSDEVGGDEGSGMDDYQRRVREWFSGSNGRGGVDLRDCPVFGAGNVGASIVIYGDAPGYFEEEEGVPFCGPAGEKLAAILKAMGLGRDDVWMSYWVKFRPRMDGQTTNGRAPTIGEMQAFAPLVASELKLLKPKVVLGLGEWASRALIGAGPEVGMAEMRGKFHETAYGTVRCTHHPSRLLLNINDLGERRELWEDMLAIMDLLGMPVSEAQRGYFKSK